MTEPHRPHDAFRKRHPRRALPFDPESAHLCPGKPLVTLFDIEQVPKNNEQYTEAIEVPSENIVAGGIRSTP